jgi:hypothetical protein
MSDAAFPDYGSARRKPRPSGLSFTHKFSTFDEEMRIKDGNSRRESTVTRTAGD